MFDEFEQLEQGHEFAALEGEEDETGLPGEAEEDEEEGLDDDADSDSDDDTE